MSPICGAATKAAELGIVEASDLLPKLARTPHETRTAEIKRALFILFFELK
jgi:hypothetical protein